MIGTAYVLEDELEPTRGRIVLFSVIQHEQGGNRRLVQVTEKHTKGGVYDTCVFNGKILAGNNNAVNTESRTDFFFRVTHRRQFQGSTLQVGG